MEQIRVYTTSMCPFCNMAKQLLKSKGYEFSEVDLGSEPDLREKLSKDNGGWRTVPMIFIGDNFVGGYQELVALEREDKLDAMVQGA